MLKRAGRGRARTQRPRTPRRRTSERRTSERRTSGSRDAAKRHTARAERLGMYAMYREYGRQYKGRRLPPRHLPSIVPRTFLHQHHRYRVVHFFDSKDEAVSAARAKRHEKGRRHDGLYNDYVLVSRVIRRRRWYLLGWRASKHPRRSAQQFRFEKRR